jgi:hypothetical protein
MWKMDMYARLNMADAWGNYRFYKLVCMSGGDLYENTIDDKDPELNNRDK